MLYKGSKKEHEDKENMTFEQTTITDMISDIFPKMSNYYFYKDPVL